MPRKKPKQPLPPVAALPEGAQEWLDQVVTGPMTAGAVEDVMRGIKKALIERALQAELSHHLGYAAGEEKPEASTNQRNGTSGKTVLTDDGPLRIDVPRDRAGQFNRLHRCALRRQQPGYCFVLECLSVSRHFVLPLSPSGFRFYRGDNYSDPEGRLEGGKRRAAH